jgi:hypothetical protein
VNKRVDVGGVIRQTFQIYADQALVLVSAAAVVFVISAIFSALLIAAAPVLAILAFVVTIIASTLFTGMVVELVADVQDGKRDSSVSQLVNAAVPVIGQLILVGIVAGIGIVIGFILIIVPGLILLTIWSVAAPVVVLERPGGLRALGRSRELVRGEGWNVFAVILLMVILVGVVSALIDGLASAGGTGVELLVRVVVGILTAPISALAAAVLYFQLRGPETGGPSPVPVESSNVAPAGGVESSGPSAPSDGAGLVDVAEPPDPAEPPGAP